MLLLVLLQLSLPGWVGVWVGALLRGAAVGFQAFPDSLQAAAFKDEHFLDGKGGALRAGASLGGGGGGEAVRGGVEELREVFRCDAAQAGEGGVGVGGGGKCIVGGFSGEVAVDADALDDGVGFGGDAGGWGWGCGGDG